MDSKTLTPAKIALIWQEFLISVANMQRKNLATDSVEPVVLSLRCSIKKGGVTVRIGILTCSAATQDLGCSSVSCLHDLRKRKGAFARYSSEQNLDLIGIINCAGCPTLAGPEKILGRIRSLAEFRVDAIHFSYCMDALCPYKSKYQALLKENFPAIEIIIGTHEAHVTHEQFRDSVKELFCQPKRTMVEVIKGK